VTKPYGNWINLVITWAIATVGFYFTQYKHTTTGQTIAVFALCLVLAVLANLGIEADRKRNRPS
jgi:hypothetical protein